ncbi:MAG TPA: TIM barrel protein [Roseiflexaceae bacterium]|nr:TIM barrel protein [Roseiflexaceae bacterium]
MNNIHIGNAPCSWGMLEFEGLEGQAIGYAQMLDELRAAGYTGTELGDWGYMPTDPAALRAELQQRDLALTGAFVPVRLRDLNAHAAGEEQAVRTAQLLVAAATEGTQPFLVLADDNGSDPERTMNAGRIMPGSGLNDEEWRIFAQGAERIARAVRDATGLRTVFHHHCAGYVEIPDEIARLLELTDPDVLGLVFDTGHYVYGSGQNNGAVVLEGLQRFGDRIWYMHFKDCQPQVAEAARANGWDYFEAVRHGVFCELGKGCVDFRAVTAWLRERNYSGWITVEQDVLPGMGAPLESAQRNREYLASLDL